MFVQHSESTNSVVACCLVAHQDVSEPCAWPLCEEKGQGSRLVDWGEGARGRGSKERRFFAFTEICGPCVKLTLLKERNLQKMTDHDSIVPNEATMLTQGVPVL